MHAVDETPGAKISLVTFGSFTNPGRTEPSYAFMNTVLRMKRTRKAVFDAYYFKAKRNDWYFSGAEGFRNAQSTCGHLSDLMGRYERTIFLGNSMGAYAALTFGLRSGADAILAFGPQTRFDESFCRRIGERRWQLEFAKMRESCEVERVSVRASWPLHRSANAVIFVGAACAQDVAYAAELAGMPGAHIRSIEGSGHDLVHDLRASGALEQAIFDGIQALEGCELD
jgi:hypothetical protein